MIQAKEKAASAKATHHETIHHDYTPGEQIRQLKHWLLETIVLKDGRKAKHLRRVIARMMMRARCAQ